MYSWFPLLKKTSLDLYIGSPSRQMSFIALHGICSLSLFLRLHFSSHSPCEKAIGKEATSQLSSRIVATAVISFDSSYSTILSIQTANCIV